MLTFIYKALKNKKLVSGEIEGKDIEEIESKLREKGLEILSIKGKSEEKESVAKPQKKILFLFGGGKVKKAEKVFLYKNLATMLKAGLPLTETLDLLRESIKSKKLIEILGQLKYDVEGGTYISASLSKYGDVFGTNEIAMIKAGEVGGTLPQSFEGLYDDVGSEVKLQKDIKGAMMYPAIILSILLLVCLLLILFVLPQLTGFFEQANIEVPTITKVIMTGSKLFKRYFLLLVAIFAGLIILLRVAIKRSKDAKRIYDKLLLKIPFIGKQIKYFYIHKFARMLGLLTKSGVPILQALEIVKGSLTHTGYSKSVAQIKDDVKLGGKLCDSLDKFPNLYPPFVSRMIKVGDRTGNTPDALANVSEFYQEELKETLENISSLIEPILMLFLGVGVAFIAISVLVPMYKIVSGINQMQK
jgi:type IV pilus assembly protein PilC